LVPTARTPGSTSITRSMRTYGNAGPLRCSVSAMARLLLLLVLVLVLALAPPGAAAVLVRRGVVELHALVRDVRRLVVVEQRPARGLQHERVAVLGAVVPHDLVQLLDDARGELRVGALQIALAVLVPALGGVAAVLQLL